MQFDNCSRFNSSKPWPDLMTLSPTFDHLSVSRNLFSKPKMGQFGVAGTEGLSGNRFQIAARARFSLTCRVTSSWLASLPTSATGCSPSLSSSNTSSPSWPKGTQNAHLKKVTTRFLENFNLAMQFCVSYLRHPTSIKS